MLPSLDLIIPCYNPPKNWHLNLKTRLAELKALLPDVTMHIILVNDGSKTGVTTKQLNDLKLELNHFNFIALDKNYGKGYALRTGVNLAKSNLQIFTDIDFPYTNQSILGIYNALQNGSDVALGNRKEEYYNHVPAARSFISKMLRAVLKNILRLPITDTQCGLKGFNNKGRLVFLTTEINRFLFDLEFVRLVTKKQKKLLVTPVEVQLRPDVEFSKMNYKVLVGELFNFIQLLFKKY